MRRATSPRSPSWCRCASRSTSAISRCCSGQTSKSRFASPTNMAAANPPISSAPALPRFGIRGLLHGLDYQWQVLICAIVGTFMVMLDQTVVNIALPKITTVFGVGVHETQLVVTSYMLALAVIMPSTGYLSDTFGTKRL